MRDAGRQALWLLLLPAAAQAQYVGKVGQTAERSPTLRATAVYEFTGTMTAPSASRLVPVVVWDGVAFQPGGLYLARPEPLAVAPGTQYVLEKSGVPAGLFNLASAGELNGAWVGLGRYAAEAPPAAPKKLAASKKLPSLTGGTGRGRAEAAGAADEGTGPVLHRKTGSEDGSTAGSGAGGRVKVRLEAGAQRLVLDRQAARELLRRAGATAAMGPRCTGGIRRVPEARAHRVGVEALREMPRLTPRRHRRRTRIDRRCTARTTVEVRVQAPAQQEAAARLERRIRTGLRCTARATTAGMPQGRTARLAAPRVQAR
ncbi:hypothetical protein D1Y84_07150 [Acidipila sp. EB88]|nr:hypothetical protein D1Y84_07150 [Acidipila sp. EB88]